MPGAADGHAKPDMGSDRGVRRTYGRLRQRRRYARFRKCPCDSEYSEQELQQHPHMTSAGTVGESAREAWRPGDWPTARHRASGSVGR